MKRFAVRFVVTFSMIAGSGKLARGEPIDGRVRLGFENGIVEYHALTVSSEGQSIDDKYTAFGLGSIPFGPLVGYGLSKHVTLTGRFEIINGSRSVNEQSRTESFGLELYTTLAYVDGEGALRPFAGPLIGVEFDSGNTLLDYDEHAFVFGVQAGVHAFATPSFSIDPSVVLGYKLGSGTQLTDTGNRAYEYDFDGFIVGLRVGVSGWLGGGRETSPVTAEPTEYAPEASEPTDTEPSPPVPQRAAPESPQPYVPPTDSFP